jgi:hypothetical protein
MTTKEHLIQAHANEGEHQVKQTKFHKAMSGHFARLAELHKATKSKMGDEDDPAATFQGISDAHEAMASECTDQAAFHSKCAKDLSASMKAAGMNGDQIVPDDIQGIVRKFPTLMPRHGAPSGPPVPDVPQEFQHLVKVEDD